ncbi:MAG: MFS transporter [Rhizobiaceae bacterium]|nr:MFS transporter [Rhizobiaceae bacterium]
MQKLNPTAAPGTAWPQVLTVVFGGTAVALQVGKASVTLTALSAAFSLSVVATASYLSCISVFAALTGWAFGSLAGRIGVRPAATVGLVIMGVASAAGAFVDDFASLMAVRLAEAVALLLFVAAAPAILREATKPGDEAAPFGLWAMWLPIGLAVGMLLGRYALEPFGWRVIHLICAVPPLSAAALMTLLVLPRRPVRHIPPPPEGGGSVMHSPEVLRMAICFGLFSVGYMTFAGFLPTLAVETMGLTLHGASMLGFWTAILVIPGNVTTVISTRIGLSHRWSLAAAFVTMAAAGTVVFLTALPTPLRIFASLVYAYAAGVAPGVLWAAIPALADATRLPAQKVSALFFQSSATGQVLGPLVAGGLVQVTGGWSVVSAVVGLAMLTAVAYVGRRRA